MLKDFQVLKYWYKSIKATGTIDISKGNALGKMGIKDVGYFQKDNSVPKMSVKVVTLMINIPKRNISTILLRSTNLT